jgi:general secretion pathway protein D
VLLITPRIMHNLSPANAVYSLIPSGVAGNNPAAMGRPAATVAKTPAAISTPQNTQVGRSNVDANFADQLMNSAPPNPAANPNTMIIQSQ